MTNFEWLISEKKSELQTILGKGELALKGTNEVRACESIACSECAFYRDGMECAECRAKWLSEQHIELQVQEGDLVQIVNTGGLYTGYLDWVVSNVDKKERIAQWAYEKSMTFDSPTEKYTDHIFRVIKIAPHNPFSDRLLAYIQDTGYLNECFLFDCTAIKKVEKTS